MTLGESLKQLRVDYGMRQSDVSETSGLHLQYIRNLENDRLNPTIRTIEKYLFPFGMTIGDLYTRNLKDMSHMVEKLEKERDKVKTLLQEAQSLLEK